MDWNITSLKLDLKYTWRISRNASDQKTNFLIKVRHDGLEGTGEVAPNIRYGETPENIASAFHEFHQQVGSSYISGIDELNPVLETLQLPNALRFGIESAWIHLQCAKQNISLNEYLSVPLPEQVATCYTLPIMDAGEIAGFFQQHLLQRFHYIKIKVNADSGLDELREVHKVCSRPLMIDANEAWKDPDAVLTFMEQLKSFHIAFVEQPLPSSMTEAGKYLKPKSPYPVMADESICADADFDELIQQFHGINMKLMKAGGYLNGIRLLNEAKARGMQTMVGCMVETTLGMSGAWALCGITDYADLDGYMVIKNEPFGLLKEENGLVEKVKSI